MWDNHSLQQIIDTTPKLRSLLNAQGMDLYPMLKKQISGVLCTYDIQIQLHIAIHRMNVIFPLVSKVRYNGFDEQASNELGINYMVTPLDDGTKMHFQFCSSEDFDIELSQQLRKPYRLHLLVIKKVYKLCRRFIMGLTQKRKVNSM